MSSGIIAQKTLKHEIEAVHNEAARIVTGATKYCNIQKLLCDLKWETLAARRRKHRLILLYKMLNGLSPTYLSNLIPGRDQTDPVRYNLRSIRCVNARTQSYSSSFLPRTIRGMEYLATKYKKRRVLITV